MTQTLPANHEQLPAVPALRRCALVAGAIVLLVAIQGWLALHGVLVARQLAGYGNLLLVLATLVYLAHLRYRAAAVGAWASALAGLGALAVLDGLWLDGAAAWAHGGVPSMLAGLQDLMGLFSACTVLLYLVMERVYKSRAAGAFLMPVVAAAVLFGSWLGEGDGGAASAVAPLLRSYVVRAHVLANVLAYGAFTLAAAAAAAALLGARGKRAMPELEAARHVVPLAVGFGLPLLSLAMALGIATAGKAWGSYWSWDPKECATLAVWLAWAGWLWLYYARGWRGVRMAWLALAGFAVTLFGFLGVRLFEAGMHAYA
ncbi:MAG TPA: cytochrome c biogenesis protein CcsA [Telluria sp.]|nr:cytochrome c biogenesis protein CcsA [Telluria sp.]